MEPRISLPLLLTIGLGAGCKGDDKSCDSGDTSCDTASAETDPYDGLTTVERVSWDCDETSYWYDVNTVGWTGGAELTIVDPGDGTEESWTEQHAMQHWANDDYGYWEELYLSLTILQEPDCTRDYESDDACWKMQESGVNTLPLCDQDTKARLSLAVAVFDKDDPTTIADCVAWGADPSQFVDCTAFDAD